MSTINPKVYNFHNFGANRESIPGAFRDNIRIFLNEFGQRQDYITDQMVVWRTLLGPYDNNYVVMPLYTVEEENISHSCQHCRAVGWGDNLRCKRNYRVIIPAYKDWRNRPETGTFDVHTHILHGIIHCNGYGHLLSLNGIEGGAVYLTGKEIMDFWDGLCTNLQARKITVRDVSKKRSMHLRLFHTVAYGKSWFGSWGYKFHQGSYGVTDFKYELAADTLSSLKLESIMQEFSNGVESKKLNQLIEFYRSLSGFNDHLITLRDLFRFIMDRISSRPCSHVKFCLPAALLSSLKPIELLDVGLRLMMERE